MKNYEDLVQATIDSMNIVGDVEVGELNGKLFLCSDIVFDVPKYSKLTCKLFHNYVQRQVVKVLEKQRDALTKVIGELE